MPMVHDHVSAQVRLINTFSHETWALYAVLGLVEHMAGSQTRILGVTPFKHQMTISTSILCQVTPVDKSDCWIIMEGRSSWARHCEAALFGPTICDPNGASSPFWPPLNLRFPRHKCAELVVLVFVMYS